MSDTRTGALVKRLVEGAQADLGDIANQVGEVRDLLHQLEGEVRGINGLAATCRGWRQQLDKMIGDVKEETDAVAKKMLGPAGTGNEITEHTSASATACGKGNA